MNSFVDRGWESTVPSNLQSRPSNNTNFCIFIEEAQQNKLAIVETDIHSSFWVLLLKLRFTLILHPQKKRAATSFRWNGIFSDNFHMIPLLLLLCTMFFFNLEQSCLGITLRIIPENSLFKLAIRDIPTLRAYISFEFIKTSRNLKWLLNSTGNTNSFENWLNFSLMNGDQWGNDCSGIQYLFIYYNIQQVNPTREQGW